MSGRRAAHGWQISAPPRLAFRRRNRLATHISKTKFIAYFEWSPHPNFPRILSKMWVSLARKLKLKPRVRTQQLYRTFKMNIRQFAPLSLTLFVALFTLKAGAQPLTSEGLLNCRIEIDSQTSNLTSEKREYLSNLLRGLGRVSYATLAFFDASLPEAEEAYFALRGSSLFVLQKEGVYRTELPKPPAQDEKSVQVSIKNSSYVVRYKLSPGGQKLWLLDVTPTGWGQAAASSVLTVQTSDLSDDLSASVLASLDISLNYLLKDLQERSSFDEPEVMAYLCTPNTEKKKFKYEPNAEKSKPLCHTDYYKRVSTQFTQIRKQCTGVLSEASLKNLTELEATVQKLLKDHIN
jgi:hypothetical protein